MKISKNYQYFTKITKNYQSTGEIQVHGNQVKIRHNIMLLWFVKSFYESNLKKLQFTTQRFDTPV